MASASGSTNTDLTKQLVQEPYRFEFFQAVRLLEWAAAYGKEPGASTAQPVGEDAPPGEEVVRFAALPSFAFPPGDIASFEPSPAEGGSPPRLVTSFLGLTGPAGVLPQHYTQLLIERIRAKDHSLQDFLDVFHHRLVSLFYRAWRKYRHYVEYERKALVDEAGDDLFTFCLFSLIGYGTSGLRHRQQVDDETFLYYGGHFAHAPRNADSLERLLGDYLGVAVQIIQFVGQWLYLERDDQSSIGPDGPLCECNNRLGENIVVGHRVWGIENKFRIRLGPLSYHEFLQYTPRGSCLKRTSQLVRSYGGPELDFDLQPVLKADEVPQCKLGGEQADSYLGWNTWLVSETLPRDADDAIFIQEGWALQDDAKRG